MHAYVCVFGRKRQPISLHSPSRSHSLPTHSTTRIRFPSPTMLHGAHERGLTKGALLHCSADRTHWKCAFVLAHTRCGIFGVGSLAPLLLRARAVCTPHSFLTLRYARSLARYHPARQWHAYASRVGDAMQNRKDAPPRACAG
ncbi:hypothetical protein EON67_09640, partial [archaeon]